MRVRSGRPPLEISMVTQLSVLPQYGDTTARVAVLSARLLGHFVMGPQRCRPVLGAAGRWWSATTALMAARTGRAHWLTGADSALPAELSQPTTDMAPHCPLPPLCPFSTPPAMSRTVPVVSKMAHNPGNGVHWERSRDFMPHSPQSRRNYGYRLFFH